MTLNSRTEEKDGGRELVTECARYFQNNPGFRRLFTGLREKYRSLGAPGGAVRLCSLEPAEQSALSGLLRRDYRGASEATVKISELAAALAQTRFSGVDLAEVLREYWGGELLSKKEERRLSLERRRAYFAKITGGFASPDAARWLEKTLVEKGRAYKTLVTRYEQDRESLREDLFAVGKALAELPCRRGARAPLPLFAAKITADPHFFDRDSSGGRLLLMALADLLATGKSGNILSEAELLYQAGLDNTEITNYVVCYGLRGYLPGGRLHPGWAGFTTQKESLQVSLENLSRLERVECTGGKVFAVENPAVFSALAAGENNFSPSLVCVNGQVNLAVTVLLDLVVRSGAVLYYSGDFDPEGLLIADRLKARYGKKLVLWRYTREDYKKTIPRRRLPAGRLKKLAGLKDPVLITVGEELARAGRAGYQELLLKSLREDIRRLALNEIVRRGKSARANTS